MSNIPQYDNSGYGPLLNLMEKELSPFVMISEKAFRYFIEASSKKNDLLKNENNNIFYLLLTNSKNSSFSIKLLSTWGQPIEGYALLRIRLEQLIVSSYLINEKGEKGIEPFKKYRALSDYNLLKANEKNENLKIALSYIFPEFGNGYSKLISEIHKQVEKSFEIKKDKFRRKWTSLYINQLAEHRDKLIDHNDAISKNKLLDYYNSIYRISSSIVHSDIASITTNFIKTNDQGILQPQEVYIFTNIITLAQLDIIHCYEIAKYFQLDINDKYMSLNDEYLNRLKDFFNR
jgi:hypothetical protein